MKQRFPDHFYNPVTLAGAIIASLSFILILFLMILDLMSGEANPYMGIITFIVMPGALIFGLILIAYGIIRERRRKARGIERKKFPVIDLNDPRYRLSFTIFIIGTVLLLFFSAFGSYKAYEYTETDSFCGELCHEPMEPEYTAYLTSPHSRVGCVQCHIGAGADWFVKSKISGAYQVYSVLFNKFSRPIPTPIEDLRPAQGTCEQCHWPRHFFSEKKARFDYYISDEKNTHSSVSMLLKIGGGNSEFGTTEGIHWHMNIANTIYYYPSDHSRQNIPWVKMISKESGEEVIYTSEEFNPADFDSASVRLMDCIDCHNRPSHIFNQPDKMMNLYIANGSIDSTLPFIKSLGVSVLEKSYSAKAAALDSIRISVEEFYRLNYPEISRHKSDNINKAIGMIIKIYQRNYFPEMNVSWKKYANNIGHVWDPGCFRCHDGNHKSKDGRVISKDCNICHTIIEQTTIDGKTQVNLAGLDFEHPVNVGLSIDDMICMDCHARN
ncbi:MAG: NapC/NirT family cytochrome c [Ignavibacteriaceae bacterium]